MKKRILYFLLVLFSVVLSINVKAYEEFDYSSYGDTDLYNDATIVFDANGGKFLDGSASKTDSQTIPVYFDNDNAYCVYPIDLQKIEAPTKVGYKFIGWHHNKNYSGTPSTKWHSYCEYDETLTKFTLYAIYEFDTSFVSFTCPSGYEDTGEGISNFPVHFYANGGSYADGTIEKIEYQDINWFVESSMGTSFIYPINLQNVESPTRAGYKFIGWGDSSLSSSDPELYWFSLTGGQADYSYYNLYAQWESENTTSTIRFLNYDGTVLQSETLEGGTLPVYKGVEPTKPSDADYNYTFNGWDKVISEVNGDCDYIAQFSISTRYYSIDLYFVTKTEGDFYFAENGEYVTETLEVVYSSERFLTLTQEKLMNKYNELLSYYKYEVVWERSGLHLSGWSLEDQGDMESIYSFDLSTTSSIHFYSVEDPDDITIRFLNYDGTVLESKVIKAYSSVSYSGVTPTRPSTVEGSYVFTGWSPSLKNVYVRSTDFTAQYDFIKSSYTVRFLNEDGTILQSSTLSYGDTPVYSGATPTKTNTAKYSYLFKGWDKDISSVTSDIDYTATFTESINKYTIRFLNEDGTVLQSTQVEYGKTPVYSGATPTKESTPEWSYTFKSWNKGITSVIGDTDYTATYNKTVNSYTIRFLNEDGTVLQSSKVDYGDTPVYTGTTPTKTPTVELQYTFNGWDKNIASVETDTDYIATFTSSIRIYTIKFYNYDGTLLNTQKFNYGTLWKNDLYTGTTPTKDAEEHYTYSFSGWTSASGTDYFSGAISMSCINQDDEFTAVFSKIPNKYKVTWWSNSGIVYRAYFEYGTMPYYNGEHAYDDLGNELNFSDEEADYVFTGFAPAYHIVEGEQDYEAQFKKNIHTYTITFANWDGTVLQSETLAYGETPAYSGDTPSKINTAQYKYTFSGWDKSITSVIENATYTAQFTSSVRSYQIVFSNWDGTILQSETLVYGEIPVYKGETPTKDAEGEIVYTFSGWNTEIILVSEDATYIAQFNSSKKKYPLKITFNLNGGYFYNNDDGKKNYSSVIKEYEDTSTFTFSQSKLSEIFDDITKNWGGYYPFGYPLKDCFKFIGWSLNLDATTIEENITFESSEVIIYAVYKQLYYLMIDYNANGGIIYETYTDGSTDSTKNGFGYEYYSETEFYSFTQSQLKEMFYYYEAYGCYNTIKREGYIFLGWSTDEKATTVDDVITCNCYTYENNNDWFELYAIWVEGDYQLLINFDSNGGYFKGNEISFITIDYGYLSDSLISFTQSTLNEAITNLGKTSLNEREGYEFIGWSASINGEVKELYEYTPTDVLTEITFYAIWKKKPIIEYSFKNQDKIYYYDKLTNQWNIKEIVNISVKFENVEVPGTIEAVNITEGVRGENEYYLGGNNIVKIIFTPENETEYSSSEIQIEFEIYEKENITITFNLYLKVGNEKTELKKTLSALYQVKTLFSQELLENYLKENNLDLIIYSCSKEYNKNLVSDETIDINFTYNTKFIYNFNMGTDGETTNMIQDISDSWTIQYLDDGILYYPKAKPTAVREKYNFLGWYYMNGDIETLFSGNFIKLSSPIDYIYLIAKWERITSSETTEEFKNIMNATYTIKNSSANANDDWTSLIKKLSVGGKIEIIFEDEYITYIFKEKGNKICEKIRFENNLAFLNSKTIEDVFYMIETVDEEKTLIIEYFLNNNEYILYYPQSGIYLSKNYITLYSRDFAYLDGEENIRSYYLYFNSDISVDHFTMMKFNYKYTWNREVVESQHTIFDDSSDLIYIASKADNRLQTLKKALEENAIQNFEEGNYSINDTTYKYRMRFIQQQTYSTGEIIISWIPLVNLIFSFGCDDDLYITTDINNPITMNYLDPLEVSYIIDGTEVANVKVYDKVNIGTDEPGGNTGEPVDITPKVNPFDFVSFFKEIVEIFKDFSLLKLIKVLLKYYGCTACIVGVIVFFPFVKSILSIVISMFKWIFEKIFSIFSRK